MCISLFQISGAAGRIALNIGIWVKWLTEPIRLKYGVLLDPLAKRIGPIGPIDILTTLTLSEEGHQLLEAGETKTQRITMKYGIFVIDLGENAVSSDELTQRKKMFLGHPNGHFELLKCKP